MWRFLFFAAFMPIAPTVAEVVDSVSDCAEFLIQESPPQVPGVLQGGQILNQNRYKAICQTFQNQRRYLTLYDTENRIPVFSAYKYKGEEKIRRPDTHWKIEPQLEERNTNNMRDDRYIHQASNSDYGNNAQYNRGHLFPVSHAFDTNDKKSTFTLTNIVPQEITFNGGSWQKMESCTKCVLQNYCINNNGFIEGFVMTGAWPSMSNTLNNRVNIPSMLWTAFCCYSHNTKEWLASAHWGDNIPEYESTHLQTKTLAELHQKLSVNNSRFEAFPGTQCPLHTTVAEFYRKMNSQCQCPPQDSSTTNNDNNGQEGSGRRSGKLKVIHDALRAALRRIQGVLQSEKIKETLEDVFRDVMRVSMNLLIVALRERGPGVDAPNDALEDLLEELLHPAINAP